MSRRTIVVNNLFLLLALAPWAQAQTYAVSELKALKNPAGVTRPYGINKAGEAVGESAGHAVLWKGGVPVDLGLGAAYGINSQGQITGQMIFPNGSHAFVYFQGMLQDLGTYLPSDVSEGRAINDAGDVAGASGSDQLIPVIFSQGAITPMGIGGYGHAYAINSQGDSAGRDFQQPSGGAFLYSPSFDPPLYLGVLPDGLWSTAYGLNDSDQVVGWSFYPRASQVGYAGHAFLYDSGAMTDLGVLNNADSSIAYAINNNGQIVGTSGSSAFIYDVNTGVINDLNRLIPRFSGWFSLEVATAISDQGQIVGYGEILTGCCNHRPAAFLLTPI